MINILDKSSKAVSALMKEHNLPEGLRVLLEIVWLTGYGARQKEEHDELVTKAKKEGIL